LLQDVAVKALSGADRRKRTVIFAGAWSLLCASKEVKKYHMMKIIHVDANRFAQIAMREQIPQIVPDAELHC
jgi:hypothetical protein